MDAEKRRDLRVTPFSAANSYLSLLSLDLSVFFSDSMYRLIAKIAFEWYCLCNDIQNKCDELEPIIQFITDGKGDNPVTIFCSGDEHTFNSIVADTGNHTLISYVPEDGSLNVLVYLFGIALYNVRLSETVPANCKYKVNYISINLDGKRTEFKARTKEELLCEVNNQMIPADTIGGLQIIVPKNINDNTILAKMFYMTSEWLNKGLDFDVDEKEISKNLKKNIDYILKRSSLTWHGLKRFVKEYEQVIGAGIKLNEKQVVTRTLFLFYLLFMVGQANGKINSFEELNKQIVKKFGVREIRLSYELCKKLQDEIFAHADYAEIIKSGANFVSNM